MEAKKCLRCGIFHLGNEDVCKTCKENDMKDIEKLNSFMDYNGLEFSELKEKEAFDKVVFELGMSSEKITRYLGIDPTADSLHVGHLVSINVAKILQKYGHKPLILVGGATGGIGDPSR